MESNHSHSYMVFQNDIVLVFKGSVVTKPLYPELPTTSVGVPILHGISKSIMSTQDFFWGFALIRFN